jgi:Rieske Fe-S protein
VNEEDEMQWCDGCTRTGRRRFIANLLPGAAAAGAVLIFPAAIAQATAWVDAGGGASADIVFPLPDHDGVFVDPASTVFLVRHGSQIFAFAKSCPHEQAELRWRPGETRFQCPRHESKFQPDGTRIEGRAKRHLDRLAIRREGPRIIVDAARLWRSDQQPAEWAAAVVVV